VNFAKFIGKKIKWTVRNNKAGNNEECKQQATQNLPITGNLMQARYEDEHSEFGQVVKASP
jgi:hypothetical protein